MEKTVQLSPSRFKNADYERTTFVATAEEHHTREMINSPDYWAHSAAKLKAYDRIEVRHDTGEFFAELLVTSVGRGWAKIHELAFYDLSKDQKGADTPTEGYEVAWKGPHLKWCVIRKSDGERIQSELGSKPEAQAWLVDYAKVAA